MPYEPLGDDAAVKRTKIPPTFSLHRYASAIGNPIGGDGNLGSIADSQHKRSQSVVRMGRSFSVRMSLQGEFFACSCLFVSTSCSPPNGTASWLTDLTLEYFIILGLLIFVEGRVQQL